VSPASSATAWSSSGSARVRRAGQMDAPTRP
jgi:hypothetical protein